MEKKVPTTSNHGGARKGAGRPTSNTHEVTIRLTKDEHEKLKQLGGSKWIRSQLKKA